MNRLTITPKRLAQLREICLSFPEASEKVAWGDPTWRVKDKIFAMQKGNVEGHRPSVWLKVGHDGQAALVDEDPKRFFVPPYVGHKGWVGVYMDGRSVPWKILRELITDSYRAIAPKRLVAKLQE